MTYFELKPSVSNDKDYMICVTEDFLDKYEVTTTGSYDVLPSRLLELSYANYLRFCRDILGAALYGKGHKYITAHFKNDFATRQFVKLLNARMELVIMDHENPLSKYEKVGII